MRTRGKLTQWFDDKGYGFIQTDEVEGNVFAHISAFPSGETFPELNEILIFDLNQDEEKGAQAHNILYANRARPAISIKPAKIKVAERKKSYTGLLVMIFIGFIVLQYLPSKHSISNDSQPETVVTPSVKTQ